MVPCKKCKKKLMGVVGIINKIVQKDLTIMAGDQMGQADELANYEK